MLKGARIATGSAEAGVSNTKNAKTQLARKPFTVEHLHRCLAGRFNRLGKKNYAAAEQHQPNRGYYRPVQLHGYLRLACLSLIIHQYGRNGAHATNIMAKLDANPHSRYTFAGNHEAVMTGTIIMKEIRITKPIVLIGMMGAGKSSLGTRLAERLKLAFVDADTEIEPPPA